MTDISKQVKDILAVHVHARNSDKELQLLYLERLGMQLSERQKDLFRKAPSMETIRRVRQKIQQAGLYKATERVAQYRRIKSYAVQQNMPQSNAEYTGKLFEDDDFNVTERRRYVL